MILYPALRKGEREEGWKTQLCGKTAPGRALQFEEELQNGAWAASSLGGEEGCSMANITVPGVSSGRGVEGMWVKGCGVKGWVVKSCFTR